MIQHAEDTLKPNKMLPNIQEDQEDSETKLDDLDHYEGFYKDGNQIFEDG